MSQVIENQYILGQSAPGTVTPGGEANIDNLVQAIQHHRHHQYHHYKVLVSKVQ